MGIDEALTAEIVRRVVETIRPERMILFGSAAAGTMTPDSDIDLLILKRPPLDPRKDGVRVREALRGLGFPFDIIIMALERFEETKDIIGGVAYPARKYGKVIYEAT
jgi:predicted nucleotidyltransferase